MKERFLLAITGQKPVITQKSEQPMKGPAPQWQVQVPGKGTTIQVRQALTSVTLPTRHWNLSAVMDTSLGTQSAAVTPGETEARNLQECEPRPSRFP